MHHPAAGATRRCPVQPSTPLGPDQVNVLLLLFRGLWPKLWDEMKWKTVETELLQTETFPLIQEAATKQP
jgi:hypothetical protein